MVENHDFSELRQMYAKKSKISIFYPFDLETWNSVEKSSKKLESWEKNFGGEIRPLSSLSDDPGPAHVYILLLYESWLWNFRRAQFFEHMRWSWELSLRT